MTGFDEGAPPPEAWHEHAKIWDQDEQARDYADQALASLLEHVDLHQGAWKQRRVLDVGCGTGLLTEKLAPLVREVVAIDKEPAMLAMLRDKQLANVTVRSVDLNDDAALSAPWLSDFELIVASSVCAFLPRYEHTVAMLARALSPGGLFVQWDWLVTQDDLEDEDGLRLTDVAAAFANAELTPVHIARTFSVLFEAASAPVLLGVAHAGAAAAS